MRATRVSLTNMASQVHFKVGRTDEEYVNITKGQGQNYPKEWCYLLVLVW